MKKLTLVVVFMTTALLSFSQIILEKNIKTGEIRTRPEADSVVWKEIGIKISPEATWYMLEVQKAIENPGDTISVSGKYRQFIDMKDFFHVQFCNVYFTGILLNENESEKSISIVKDYRTETQTVFAWQNVLGIISVLSFFFLNKLIKKGTKSFLTGSVFLSAFLSTLALAILCMAINIALISQILFFSGIIACVIVYFSARFGGEENKKISYFLGTMFYVLVSSILVVPLFI